MAEIHKVRLSNLDLNAWLKLLTSERADCFSCALCGYYYFSVVRLNTLCIKLKIMSWWYRRRLHSASYFRKSICCVVSSSSVFCFCCYLHNKFRSGKSTVSNTNIHTQVYIRTYIRPWTHRGSGRLSDLLLWNQRAASAINWQSSTPCCLCNGDRKNTHIVKHCDNTNIYWEERRGERRGGEERRGEEERRGQGRRGVWCDTVWLRAMKSEWVYGEIKGLRNKGEKAWADRYRVHKVQEPAGAPADSNSWVLLIGNNPQSTFGRVRWSICSAVLITSAGGNCFLGCTEWMERLLCPLRWLCRGERGCPVRRQCQITSPPLPVSPSITQSPVEVSLSKRLNPFPFNSRHLGWERQVNGPSN